MIRIAVVSNVFFESSLDLLSLEYYILSLGLDPHSLAHRYQRVKICVCACIKEIRDCEKSLPTPHSSLDGRPLHSAKPGQKSPHYSSECEMTTPEKLDEADQKLIIVATFEDGVVREFERLILQWGKFEENIHEIQEESRGISKRMK